MIHSQGPKKSIAFTCHGCGDPGHVVSLNMWEYKNTDPLYVDIYVSDEFKYPSGPIARIKALWNFIRRANYCRGDVGLDKGQLLQIKDWIDEVIDYSEHQDKPIEGDI